MTVELCGSWDHAGGCRWPHNNDIHVDGRDATFRTVFAADPSDAREVHDRIELALHTAPGWVVVASGSREVAVNEQALAASLDETPPPTRFQGGDG